MVEQRSHVNVALTVGGGAQDDTDQPHPAAQRAGDQVVAGRLGIAGLQPVRARIGL